jgi:hypothetical protein
MVSFELHSTWKTAANALLLAAAAAPCVGLSQPPDEAAADRQRLMVASIEQEKAENGPYSEGLIDPLASLALLYQEDGDRSLAAAAIDQALQVVRVNYGLHSLQQAPLLRQAVDNERARGNAAAAWNLEKRLLTLARRHPNDLRTVPIFREIGDGRMDVLKQYINGKYPPEIVLGCYYGPSPYDAVGNCRSGSRSVVIRSILADAMRTYSDAIRVLLRHDRYSSDELRELETELVRDSYLYGDRRSYSVGKLSLRRTLAYDVANSEPWLTRITALVEMADWDLLYAQYGPALDTYKQAYSELQVRDIPSASIEQLFSPATPVLLPTFLPNPLVSDQGQQSSGYIDVAFEISKFGASRQVQIIGSSQDATDAAKDWLVQLIKRSRFRPRVVDGQFADGSRVVVRYFPNGD